MRRKKTRILFSSIWILITLLTLVFFLRAFPAFYTPTASRIAFSIKTFTAQQVLKTYVPGICYSVTQGGNNSNSPSLIELCISQWQPLSAYMTHTSFMETASESAISDTMIATGDDGADSFDDENSNESADKSGDSSTSNTSKENTPQTNETSDNSNGENDTATKQTTATVTQETIAMNRTAGTTYTSEQLSNFSFLLNSFFTLDPTTTVDETLLNGSNLSVKDMSITKDSTKPQILIYHTHSQEEFVDSTPGDPATSIVGVGEYLATLLRDVYGYNVIHNTTTFDIVDGELDRNKAYTQALKEVSNILEENPSIEVVIDLHRDGISGNKMTTMVNGKETAKLMFFNGLSRTAKNGEISYLYNPYIQDNLAFSLQLQLKANAHYPDVMRPIYLKGYRYNLHLRPRCLLVEAGSQKNTFQEELNAMEVLADVLNMVLSGET